MESAVEKQYREKWQSYDRQAILSKRNYHLSWLAILLLSWVPLLWLIALSETSMIANHPQLWLYTIAATCFAASFLTLAQLIYGFRGKWLSARADAELLRNLGWQSCIVYKDTVAEEEKTCDEDRFRKQINEIHRSIENSRLQLLLGNIRELIRMPRELRELPKLPPIPQPQRQLSEEEYVQQRVQSSRKWYLQKARKYILLFLTFQISIIFSGIFVGFWHLLHGLSLPLALTCYAWNLAAIAGRDFLGCWPLFIRYIVMSSSLAQLQQKYLENKKILALSHHDRLLRDFVNEVELLLNAEIKYWYVSHSGVPLSTE